MQALHTIELHRPTRTRRARLALVDAVVPHSASHGLTAYTYNALGQVLTAQNPEVTYSHTYDSAHRLSSVTQHNRGRTTNIF